MWKKLSDAEGFVSCQKLLNMLGKRYDITSEKFGLTQNIMLSHSKTKVTIVQNDVKACMQSLLTDTRIRDEDYLFFQDDPFAAPPKNLNYIADLNTGESYTKTYEKLITKPGKQVLLPVIFYIDGANTGHFADLGNLPCHLMGFVDLSDLPQDFAKNYANLAPLMLGIYAIAQCAEYIEDEARQAVSEIFIPIRKVVGGFTQNRVGKLELYLVDVESFVAPLAVIPDLGGPANEYFVIKDQVKWVNDFMEWLDSPYEEIEEETEENSDDGWCNFEEGSNSEEDEPDEEGDSSDSE